MSTPHDAYANVSFVSGAEGANQPAFDGGPAKVWNPSDSPYDPHDEPYDDIGDTISPVEGAVPPNIVGGGGYPPGPISKSRQ